MAEKFQTFDLWNPVVEDFDFETLARVNELRRRWIDNHTWGVVRENSYPVVVNIPVSAINLVPNRKWVINQFPVKLDVANGRLNIGEGSTQVPNPSILGGVAYDINGERIAILTDETFDFSNDVPYGKKSSGNIDVPLTLTGVTGTCATNPSVPGTYYVWIEYLETNQNLPTVGEDGAIHYPKIVDGYRIRLTGTPDAPSGDGVSVFLVKVIWVGGAGFLTVSDLPGDQSATDGSNTVDTAPTDVNDPKRVYSAVRDSAVEIVVDETNKTAVYASGMIGDLRDHINAMGGGSPTPNNPHALTLADIPGAGEEPLATNNQKDSFAKGIIDYNAAQNSPARLGDALRPFIEVTGLTPTVLDAAATTVGITSTPKVQWIRLKDLDNISKTKAAFTEGFRLKRLYPNLRQSNLSSDPSINPADPETGDGWIGFNNAEDTPGVYRLYGTKATLSDGTDVLMLNKELLPGWPSAILPLTDDKLLLGQVYWDGVTVFRNTVQPTTSDPTASQPDDQRSLGLVGPQQLSTELKNDAVTGGLAAQVFEQQAANSNYALGTLNVTEVDFGALRVISLATAVTAGTDASIATPPVGAITGRKWTTNAGASGTLGTSKVFHLLKNLKPGRMYGISWFYKADAGFSVRFRVGLADGNGSGPNSLITVDGVSSVDPLDVTILNDGQWHRASIVVQTLSGVDPDPAVLKYLEFLFQQGGIATTVGNFSMTNIQVTEGEWIPGYMGSKYVPSGAIILWDQTTSCPPGFQEVPGLQGRFPVGGGPNYAPLPLPGQSASQLDPGTPGVLTSAAGSHTHTGNTGEAGATTQVVNGTPSVGQGNVDVSAENHDHTFPPGVLSNPGNHQHTVDGGLPYYTVLFCRAI